MPYIQLDERQFPLRVGESRLGGPGAEIALPGAAPAAAAVVQFVVPDQVFIRRGDGATVLVNGVRLGAEPTPLFHGDKIEVAGLELLFGDDRRAGSTQFLATPAGRGGVAAAGRARRAPARPTAATGGRLVSLVDGREYAVPATGATIGRDAACEVVVASGDVSRRHAELRPGDGGYLLRDLSTNGVCVNDERIAGEQLLGRGDVVRVGSEEFRFYADELPAAAARDGDGVAAPAAPAGGAREARVPSLADTMARPALRDLARPVLATLEVINQGVQRGRRFEVRTPLAHVGRGAHNDVVVADDSVSETHAKLQKREAGWFVVDMNSTNGTYVGGKRIRGEQRLDGVSELRFGGVKLAFEPAGAAPDDAAGTRVIAARGAPPRRPSPRASQPAGDASPTASGGAARWLWVVGAAAVGATAIFLFRQAR